eukprot:scaffold547_cov384-Prasinococcus_capsulatus_cf.AAC.5
MLALTGRLCLALKGVLQSISFEGLPKHCRYGDPSNAYRAVAMNKAMQEYGGEAGILAAPSDAEICVCTMAHLSRFSA